MFRRNLKPDPDASWQAERAARRSDPEAACETMWTPPQWSFVKCERPIAQSIPHDHRSVYQGFRYESNWASPGNYNNDFESAARDAADQAWATEIPE